MPKFNVAKVRNITEITFRSHDKNSHITSIRIDNFIYIIIERLYRGTLLHKLNDSDVFK